MKRTVTAPDGARWVVRTAPTAWRPRLRVSFEIDPVGVFLWLLAWPLLLIETVAALLVSCVRTTLRAAGAPCGITASTPGPPQRIMTWTDPGRHERARRIEDIAARLASGAPVAADARTRVVGDSGR